MAGIILAGSTLFNQRNNLGILTGWLALGNSKKFEIKEDTQVETRISTNPDSYGTVLDSVVIPKPNEITISTDEFNPDNLALLFRGTTSTISVGANTGITETFIATINRYYQLQYGNLTAGSVSVADASITPVAWAATTAEISGALVHPVTSNGHYYACIGAGTTGSTEPTWPTTGGTVTDGSVTWKDQGTTILVEGVDYTVNYRLGMIQPNAKGRIAANDTLHVTYSNAAISETMVTAGYQMPALGQLMMDGVNLATKKRVELYVPQIILSASGSLDFLAEKFTPVALKGSATLAPGETAPYYITILE